MYYSVRLIIFLVGCILYSCRSSELKTIKIKTVEVVDLTVEKYAEDVIVYHFKIPKTGFQNKSFKSEHAAAIFFTYKDSSLIYFYEDQLSVTPNITNIEQTGGLKRKSLIDTIYYGGIQRNGRVWQEQVLGEIIIGYRDVPPDRKKEFDTALASIKKVKTTLYVNGRKMREKVTTK
jgi:hypothetical protein